jgi:hypothetical protein
MPALRKFLFMCNIFQLQVDSEFLAAGAPLRFNKMDVITDDFPAADSLRVISTMSVGYGE